MNSTRYYYAIVFACFTSILLLSGCSNLKTTRVLQSSDTSKNSDITSPISIKLSAVDNSEFLQVQATFYSHKSRALIFRVLSDLALTPQWFDQLSSIESLELYDNNNFLIRSVIDSPWPFKDRELITCVSTLFAEQITTISITSCTDKHPKSPALVRVINTRAQWQLTTLNNNSPNSTTKTALTKITYTAWIEPAGSIPPLLVNSQLQNSTLGSLNKLRALINKVKISDYTY